MEKLGIEMDESKETINEVMGISKKEAIEIMKAVDDAIERNDTVTKVMEDLLAEYDGAKAVLAIYSLGIRLGAKRAIERILIAAAKEAAVWW